MHHETTITKARETAKKAWDATGGADIHAQFFDDRFEAALRAYMTVLANNIVSPQLVTAPVQKAIDVTPVERSPGEHFLAMCSGHYQGYTLTSGMLPDRIARRMICYQPDEKSSILYPLFISLLKEEMEYVVDLKGNPFLIAMTGAPAPLVVG